MKYLAAIVCFAFCLILQGHALSLSRIERGAAVVVKYPPGSQGMTDAEFLEYVTFVDFVRDFYHWLPLITTIREQGPEELKARADFFPTAAMGNPQNFAPAILKFLTKHKPKDADMSRNEGHALVLAWYLWDHPNSGAWQKIVAEGLLIKCFGEDYNAKEEVRRAIDEATDEKFKQGSSEILKMPKIPESLKK